MSKRVVVFGGTGFIGSYVANELARRGYDYIVADIKPCEYIEIDRFRYCNIFDEDAVRETIQDAEVVYNFAGLANMDDAVRNPVQTIKLNVGGNLNILEASRQMKVKRYIFASSTYALSHKGSFYGISKLCSEKLIEEYFCEYGIRFTIIRYGSVYGERAYNNNYIYNLVSNAIKHNEIIHDGDGEEIREYIHGSDAAVLSVDIIENNKFENEHIILTGIERIKRVELFTMIKEILNKNLKITLQNSNNNHYKITPYSYKQPTTGKKLIANPQIDMGQGILECINEIYRKSQCSDTP